MVSKDILYFLVAMLVLFGMIMWTQLAYQMSVSRSRWGKETAKTLKELSAFKRTDDETSFDGTLLNGADRWKDYACLYELNEESNRILFNNLADQKCHISYYLLSALTRGFDESNTKRFCLPSLAKLAIAKAATECKMDGYWITYPNEDLHQFVPMENEKDLERMMGQLDCRDP